MLCWDWILRFVWCSSIPPISLRTGGCTQNLADLFKAFVRFRLGKWTDLRFEMFCLSVCAQIWHVARSMRDINNFKRNLSQTHFEGHDF